MKDIKLEEKAKRENTMKMKESKKRDNRMTERQLLKEWLDKNEQRPVSCIRHIHKHAYVVGYAAPQCLVVSLCWTEAEPQMKDFERAYPLNTMHIFDKELQAGDWCITAYVRFKNGGGEKVAIKIQDKK